MYVATRDACVPLRVTERQMNQQVFVAIKGLTSFYQAQEMLICNLVRN